MTTDPKDISKESLELNANNKLFQIYKNLKYVTLKCDTYFHAYEEMFHKYHLGLGNTDCYSFTFDR